MSVGGMEAGRQVAAADAGRRLDGVHAELWPAILRYARTLVGHDADAEDLAQEVLMTVVEHAAEFQGGKAGFRSWVFHIAHNRAIDLLRARGRRATLPLDEEFLASPDVEPPIESQESIDRVRTAMESLPEADRLLLALKYKEGLGNAEIAALTGLTANHVGVALFRARQQLRAKLKE